MTGIVATVRFDSGFVLDDWGVADAAGFQLYEDPQPYTPGFPFIACRIDGRQVAVFIDMEVPVEARANLEPLKPDWLDALVYAKLDSDAYAEAAVIDAHVVQSPDGAGLETCAFATAYAAFALGLFQVEPTSYLVRFEARAPVRVVADFDWDTESWFGEATMDFDDTP